MSLVATLREGTSDCHVALEKSLDLLQRVTTPVEYRELIKRFFTLYEPLEAELAAVVDWNASGWDFSAHRKTPWLREDLLALGVPATEIADWPRCESTKTPASFGAAIGCAYVLEGSTLGGQMLAKQFRDTLGITPQRGGQFFQGYGAATMPSWRAFGGWADAQANADPHLKDQAVRGARDTFEVFSRWLT